MKKSQLYLYATAAFLYSFNATASDAQEAEATHVAVPSLSDSAEAVKKTSSYVNRSGWFNTLVDFMQEYSQTGITKADLFGLGEIVKKIPHQTAFQEIIDNLGYVERLHVLMKENGNPVPLTALLTKSLSDLAFEFRHSEMIKCRDKMWQDFREAERKVFLQRLTEESGVAVILAPPRPEIHPRDMVYNYMCANGIYSSLVRLLETYSQEVDATRGKEVFADEALLTGHHGISLTLLEGLGEAFVVHNISAENKDTIPLAHLMRYTESEMSQAFTRQIKLRQGTIKQYLDTKDDERLLARIEKEVSEAPAASLEASEQGDAEVVSGQSQTLVVPVNISELTQILIDINHDVSGQGDEVVENDNNKPEGQIDLTNATEVKEPVPATTDASDDQGVVGKEQAAGASVVSETKSNKGSLLNKLKVIGRKKKDAESENK